MGCRSMVWWRRSGTRLAAAFRCWVFAWVCRRSLNRARKTAFTRVWVAARSGEAFPAVGRVQDTAHRLEPALAGTGCGCCSKASRPDLTPISTIRITVSRLTVRRLAVTTDYGMQFASAVCCGNLYGVQFHPEKSQQVGQQLLKNFMDITL